MLSKGLKINRSWKVVVTILQEKYKDLLNKGCYTNRNESAVIFPFGHRELNWSLLSIGGNEYMDNVASEEVWTRLVIQSSRSCKTAAVPEQIVEDLDIRLTVL